MPDNSNLWTSHTRSWWKSVFESEGGRKTSFVSSGPYVSFLFGRWITTISSFKVIKSTENAKTRRSLTSCWRSNGMVQWAELQQATHHFTVPVLQPPPDPKDPKTDISLRRSYGTNSWQTVLSLRDGDLVRKSASLDAIKAVAGGKGHRCTTW